MIDFLLFVFAKRPFFMGNILKVFWVIFPVTVVSKDSVLQRYKSHKTS